MRRGLVSAAVVGIGLGAVVSAAAPVLSPAHPEIRWGGRAVAIAVDPNDSAHELVASESGGLFETSDGAATWRRIDALRPF